VRVEYLSHLTSHISPFALSYLNHRNSDKKRSAAQSLVFVSSNPGPIPDLGKSNTTTISKGYTFMRFYNITLLGSLTALVFLGVGTAQTQSFPASFRQPAATSSVPANVAGGFAKFSPDFKIDSVEKAADGAMAHTTATFPLPAISGHPVAVRAISPGIFPQGILFLPIDPQSQPAKAGDFALLGGVSLSYPRDGIFIAFTDFREDISGNLFGRFFANGQDVGGGEIELANATGAKIGQTSDHTQFTISAKLQISAAFAQLVNRLFHAAVLSPGQQIATEDLVADVAN
jgi:hypothetical protein